MIIEEVTVKCWYSVKCYWNNSDGFRHDQELCIYSRTLSENYRLSWSRFVKRKLYTQLLLVKSYFRFNNNDGICLKRRRTHIHGMWAIGHVIQMMMTMSNRQWWPLVRWCGWTNKNLQKTSIKNVNIALCHCLRWHCRSHPIQVESKITFVGRDSSVSYRLSWGQERWK